MVITQNRVTEFPLFCNQKSLRPAKDLHGVWSLTTERHSNRKPPGLISYHRITFWVPTGWAIFEHLRVPMGWTWIDKMKEIPMGWTFPVICTPQSEIMKYYGIKSKTKKIIQVWTFHKKQSFSPLFSGQSKSRLDYRLQWEIPMRNFPVQKDTSWQIHRTVFSLLPPSRMWPRVPATPESGSQLQHNNPQDNRLSLIHISEPTRPY